jgi:hypothetical protein
MISAKLAGVIAKSAINRHFCKRFLAVEDDPLLFAGNWNMASDLQMEIDTK